MHAVSTVTPALGKQRQDPWGLPTSRSKASKRPKEGYITFFPSCRPSSETLAPKPGPVFAKLSLHFKRPRLIRPLKKHSDWDVSRLHLTWTVTSKLCFLQRNICKHLLFSNQMSWRHSSLLPVWKGCRAWWTAACR